MQVIPYLMFNGNCREAFEFYEKTLGGKINAMMSYGDMPEDQRGGAPANAVMHACLMVGDESLMASDDCTGTFQPAQGMTVSLHPKTQAENERIFNALAEGGTVHQPMIATFWTTGFGVVTDRFGTPWMLNGPAPEGAECGGESA
jgi:PhnB protein